MQVTETNTEGLKREFTVVVAAEDIDSKIGEKLAEVGRTVKLPGFRPGKIPPKILKQRFGASVMADVVQGAVRDSSTKLLADRGIRPAMQPKIEIKSFDEGKPLEYDLSVEQLPEVVPADFGSIELERWKAAARDEDVDSAVERIATEQKRTKPIEKERPAKSGDVAVIDFVGKIDGQPFDDGTASDFHLELGSDHLVPGFEAQLIGRKPGDKVAVSVTFPADYRVAELAGKDATFDCDIKELREKDPVEIDEEFAKSMGLEGLTELRDTVREQIDQQYQQIAKTRLKRQLLDRLAELHDFSVPPGMVEAEFETIWKQLEEAREKGQLDADDQAKDEDELKAQYREIAERRVRLGLVLSTVGERNELTVTPEEVNRAIMAEARRYPGQEQEVIKFYTSNEQARAAIQAPIFEDKVVDFIVEIAKVSEREVSPEEMLASGADGEAADAEDAKPATEGKQRAPKKSRAKQAGNDASAET